MLPLSENISEIPPSISTLVELLHYRSDHQGQQRAFLFLEDGEQQYVEITYQQLEQKAIALALHLQSMNLSEKKALLLFPSCLEYIIAIFGCMYANVLSIPAYPPQKGQNLSRIEAIAFDAQAEFALTTKKLLPKLKKEVLGTSLESLQWIAIDEYNEDFSSKNSLPVITPATLAYLQYTSGSTGIPKGVMVNHQNLLSNVKAFDIFYGHELGSSMVSWVPIFHDMGIVWGVISPIYSGFPCYFMEPSVFLQKPIRWLRAISQYRATHSGAPNFAYDICLNKITEEECRGLDLSSWQVSLVAAEPVRVETLKRFSKKFQPYGFSFDSFCPAYGLAEATLLVNTIPKKQKTFLFSIRKDHLEQHKITTVSEDYREKILLAGHGNATTDTEILIVNPDSHEKCPEETLGEIWVRGITIAQGYWNREQETKETFYLYLKTGEGPYLRTGDLGFFKNQELFITGRLKDLIIIHGRNHYPHDIEITVEQSHNALRPGCCIAFSVEKENEEKLVVVQELKKESQSLTPEVFSEIFQKIRANVLTQHEIAVSSILLIPSNSLLKTSSGKKQRRGCQKSFLAKKLSTVSRWDQNEEVLEIPVNTVSKKLMQTLKDVLEPEQQRFLLVDFLKTTLQKILKQNQLEIHQPLIYLGLDSVLAIEFRTALEEEFGILFEISSLLAFKSLFELAFEIQNQLHLNKVKQTTPSNIVFSELSTKPPVILIQQGSQNISPLFMIHGLGQGMLSRYRNIAQYLDPHSPIYYIFASWDHEGLDTFKNFEEIANLQVREIKKIQPHGPYSLLGYCLGGNIAFEVAQQLRSQGEEVLFLGMIDTLYNDFAKKLFLWKPLEVYLFSLSFFLKLKKILQKPQLYFQSRLSPESHYFQTQLQKQFQKELQESTLSQEDLKQFVQWNLKVLKIHQEMWGLYKPNNYPYKITLFRTSIQPLKYSYSLDLGWKQVAENVDVIKLPGSHQEIMTTNVSILARAVKKYLDNLPK